MSNEGVHVRKPHFRGDGVQHATVDGMRLHFVTGPGKHGRLWINGKQPPFILDETARSFVSYFIEAVWLLGQNGGNEPKQEKVDAIRRYVVDKMYKQYNRR